MEKLDSALSLWIVLYNNLNFQSSYLHTFYKPNNIKTKSNTKFKTYIRGKGYGIDFSQGLQILGFLF